MRPLHGILHFQETEIGVGPLGWELRCVAREVVFFSGLVARELEHLGNIKSRHFILGYPFRWAKASPLDFVGDLEVYFNFIVQNSRIKAGVSKTADMSGDGELFHSLDSPHWLVKTMAG